MNWEWLIWSIWVINALLQWALLMLVLSKNSWRQHPAFALYVAFCSCKTSLLISIDVLARSHYFSVNWAARLIGVPLMIAVLVEVFAAVFQPYSTLPKGTLRWFRIAFATLILLTAGAALCFSGSTPGSATNTVFVLNRSVSIIFGGAFGFTALVSSYYGIPWRTRTYGIGAGFLLFMSVDLFTSSLSAMYGIAVINALRCISMLAYTLALITWITYFAKPDVPSRAPTIEQLRHLQKALDYSAKKVESTLELR